MHIWILNTCVNVFFTLRLNATENQMGLKSILQKHEH